MLAAGYMKAAMKNKIIFNFVGFKQNKFQKGQKIIPYKYKYN